MVIILTHNFDLSSDNYDLVCKFDFLCHFYVMIFYFFLMWRKWASGHISVNSASFCGRKDLLSVVKTALTEVTFEQSTFLFVRRIRVTNLKMSEIFAVDSFWNDWNSPTKIRWATVNVTASLNAKNDEFSLCSVSVWFSARSTNIPNRDLRV